MRIFLSTVFLLCLMFMGFAQKKEIIRVDPKDYTAFIAKNQYKFPAFTKANIYFKSGDVASVRFNYDYISHLLKYITKNDTLAIANEKDVKYITIATDTIFIDNKFYEWVASSSFARLGVTHLLNLNYKDTQLSDPWASSPAIQVETHQAILENTHIPLHPKQITVFSREVAYYICLVKDGRFVEANKKNFTKFFPDKNIEGYIKDNKLSLDNENDLVNIFTYASNK